MVRQGSWRRRSRWLRLVTDAANATCTSQSKKKKASAATSIVVCHVRSLLKSNRGKLRDVFLQLDKDGGGSIDKDEFCRGLMSLGIELQDKEVDEVFNQIDVNGDGDVSLREFMSVVAKPVKPIKIIFHDFFDGIRSIGVYISREHAIAVYEYCQTKTGGPIDPVKLEKLINDPVQLQQLHPNNTVRRRQWGIWYSNSSALNLIQVFKHYPIEYAGTTG